MLPSFVMDLRESSANETAGCVLKQLKHLMSSWQFFVVFIVYHDEPVQLYRNHMKNSVDDRNGALHGPFDSQLPLHTSHLAKAQSVPLPSLQ